MAIYVEAGARLTGKVDNNPGVIKGVQTVLISDVHRINLHAYRHIQKLHVNPPGWHRWELPVLHYHKIMGIYPYPFFVVINQLFSCIIFINGCICILNDSHV